MKYITKRQLLEALSETPDDQVLIFQNPFSSASSPGGPLYFVGTGENYLNRQRFEGLPPNDFHTVIDFETAD